MTSVKDASSKAAKSMLTMRYLTFGDVIGAALVPILAAGVIGLWYMSSAVTRLEERVSGWTKIYDQKVERVEGKLDSFNQSLQGLSTDVTILKARSGTTPR